MSGDRSFEEDQIDIHRRQKFFERFKRNFPKVLAVSLAILNLFFGNFSKAANAKIDDADKTKIVNQKIPKRKKRKLTIKKTKRKRAVYAL